MFMPDARHRARNAARWLPVAAASALLVGGIACGGKASPCWPEEGVRLASVGYPVRALAFSAGYLYWLDPEPATETSVRGVLKRVRVEGGGVERLAESDAPEALLRNNVLVAGAAAFWLDPCPVPAPTCARIVTAPVTGGAPRVLFTGRVFAFTVHGDDLFFTLSDEWGLQEGAPDGEVRRMPAAGGEPTLLAAGFTHLREVLADETRVYVSVATSGADADRRARILAISRADAAAAVLVDTSGVGGARAHHLALGVSHLYFSTFGEVSRVPLAGGAVEPLGASGARSLADLAVEGEVVVLADSGAWEGTTDDAPGTYRCGAVRTLRPGSPSQVLAGGQTSPSALATAPGWVYWATEGYADRHDGGLFRTPLP